MKTAFRIAGTGSYLPRRAVTNRELAKTIRVDPEWIEDRTGIRSRCFAAPGESVSDLALAASGAALKSAECTGRDLDAIIASTLTPDRHFPGIGVDLQARLKCNRIPAFDLNCQCNGFIFALSLAASSVIAGQFRRVLVAAAEIHSRELVFRHETRDWCVLFGDGAGAVVVERTGGHTGGRPSFLLHSDGHFADDLSCPRARPEKHGRPEPRMNKTSVIIHSSRSVTEVCQGILAENRLTLSQVDFLIPHQSNARLIHEVARRLDCPLSKVIINIEKTGNTSSASIPIALDQAVRSKRIRRGDMLLMVSFGAGFSWGAALLTY